MLVPNTANVKQRCSLCERTRYSTVGQEGFFEPWSKGSCQSCARCCAICFTARLFAFELQLFSSCIFGSKLRVAQQLHLGATFEQALTLVEQVCKAAAEAGPRASKYRNVTVSQAHKGGRMLAPAAAKLRYPKPTRVGRKLAQAAAKINSKYVIDRTRYTRTRTTKKLDD